MMVRESVIEKWIESVEEYIPWGVPPSHFESPERLDNELEGAIEWFCHDRNYSQRTINELLEVMDVRDAYYKTLSENDYRLPSDAESPSNSSKEAS